MRQDIVWQRSNIQDYLSTGPNVDNYNQVIWSYVFYALPGGQAHPPDPPPLPKPSLTLPGNLELLFLCPARVQAPRTPVPTRWPLDRIYISTSSHLHTLQRTSQISKNKTFANSGREHFQIYWPKEIAKTAIFSFFRPRFYFSFFN